MKRKPTGFVATCQCGLVIGAMDATRTDNKAMGQTLGKWLYDGCSVEPRFIGSWEVEVKVCQCGKEQDGA